MKGSTMTGRELIKAICFSMYDFDEEIPVRFVFRDAHGSTTYHQYVDTITFINGKLGIEMNSLSDKELAI